MGETRDDLLGVPVLQSLILAARRRVVQGALYGTGLSVYYWSRYLPGRAGLPLLRYPNTPPQAGASPISLVCCACFGRGSAFVKTSAVCCLSRQLSSLIVPFSNISLRKCHLMSICFDLWCDSEFFAIASDPLLSSQISVSFGSVHFSL